MLQINRSVSLFQDLRWIVLMFRLMAQLFDPKCVEIPSFEWNQSWIPLQSLQAIDPFLFLQKERKTDNILCLGFGNKLSNLKN
jgi:hypothetical protein